MDRFCAMYLSQFTKLEKNRKQGRVVKEITGISQPCQPIGTKQIFIKSPRLAMNKPNNFRILRKEIRGFFITEKHLNV
jgi:hypothetical protein